MCLMYTIKWMYHIDTQLLGAIGKQRRIIETQLMWYLHHITKFILDSDVANFHPWISTPVVTFAQLRKWEGEIVPVYWGAFSALPIPILVSFWAIKISALRGAQNFWKQCTWPRQRPGGDLQRFKNLRSLLHDSPRGVGPSAPAFPVNLTAWFWLFWFILLSMDYRRWVVGECRQTKKLQRNHKKPCINFLYWKLGPHFSVKMRQILDRSVGKSAGGNAN